MLHILAVLSLSLYFSAAVLFLMAVMGMRLHLARPARYITAAAFILHTVLLLPVFESYKGMPESRAEYIFWLSWTLGLFYFALRKKSDYPIIGAFVAPACAFLLTASSYLSHAPHAQNIPEVNRFLVFSHVIPAFFAELSLLIAFIIGCTYLFQQRRLKRRAADTLLSSGPNLAGLEQANRKVLYLGFIAMTVAILSGTFWALERGEFLVSMDLYQWFSLLVWLVLAFLLHVKDNMHWTAGRFARLTVLLTGIVLIVTGLILAVQGNLIHNYGS